MHKKRLLATALTVSLLSGSMSVGLSAFAPALAEDKVFQGNVIKTDKHNPIPTVNENDIRKIEAHLKRTFGSANLVLKPRRD